ncbi:DUF732 domain-containing protein [Mycolicibacter arupensis]|jgi:hypothetical protein|uniref:DUF732 domain-containing protein n=1 Tax=Mycolicibacter arupensis TaxID=342002 RepID=A0ABX3RV88_9MYCO|nr:DUF732 domain-containing protein [Mycolicibacter arupensis]OQZ98098.1 hypothetical protein BST15_09080 [Mycolicibacter arupensis]
MTRTAHTVGIGIAALGLLLGSAGTAHADDASFVATVRSNGIWTDIMSESTLIGLGHIMCSSLRDGSSLETVAGYPRGADGYGIAVTAQHELCPDTLGGPK